MHLPVSFQAPPMMVAVTYAFSPQVDRLFAVLGHPSRVGGVNAGPGRYQAVDNVLLGYWNCQRPNDHHL